MKTARARKKARSGLLLLAWIPTSVIVDSAGLAYEEKPPTVSFVPVVQLQKGGATFGLGGTF